MNTLNSINSTEKGTVEIDTLMEEFKIDKPLDEELVEKYIDGYSEIISMNEHIDINFIRKWKEKLDWRTLSTNFQFSESELLEFFGSIHWKSAVYCQPACTKKFIEENDLVYVIDQLQKFNREFMEQSEELMSKLDKFDIISEDNIDTVLETLVRRAHGKITSPMRSDLDVIFEDGDIYIIPNGEIENFLRDVKINIIENNDIIDCIKQSSKEYDIRNN
jgi:hypothetical protein